MKELTDVVFAVDRILSITHDDSIRRRMGYEYDTGINAKLVYKISGHVRFFLHNSDTVLDFSPGMVAYIPPHTGYRIERPEPGEAICINLLMQESCVDDIPPFSVLYRTHAAFADLFAQAETYYRTEPHETAYRTMSAIYEIFALLESSARYSAITPVTEKRIHAAVAELEERYADPDLNIADVSEHAGISPAALRRNFLHLYGVPPIRYLMRLRVNAARSLLIGSERNIEEIALLCGFRDPFYFSRCFKTFCGENPRDFRSRQK